METLRPPTILLSKSVGRDAQPPGLTPMLT